jgi:NAD-dependent deacetylase sirtuin 2
VLVTVACRWLCECVCIRRRASQTSVFCALIQSLFLPTMSRPVPSPAWHPDWTTPRANPLEEAVRQASGKPSTFGCSSWAEMGDRLEANKAAMRANAELMAQYPQMADTCSKLIQYCSPICQKQDHKRHRKTCTAWKPKAKKEEAGPAATTAAASAASGEILTAEKKAEEEAPTEAKHDEPKPDLAPLEVVCRRIARGDIRRIVVLTGAGCSTSAGIPDFRSSETGLYANLARFNLERPEDIFRMSYFRDKPQAFYTLARELYPDGTRYRPTCAHWFIRLLQERGRLLRNVTQNIDGLEQLAGLRHDEHVVQAHGGFDRAACIECDTVCPSDEVREAIMEDRIPRCDAHGGACNGLVKPSIVFFEESLPEAFHRTATQDLPACDLLLVMGTSLKVQPFSGLINLVGANVPRIVINRERVGELMHRALENDEYQAWRDRLDHLPPGSSMRDKIQQELAALRRRIGGFEFDARPERDIFIKGDCDAGVRQLAALIGDEWITRLEQLVQADKVHAASAALFAK